MRLSSVGIVTYHAAYNFGSVLQALGTQIAFEKHGCSASIINYRPSGQRAFYEMLYRTNRSLKTLINDLSLISVKFFVLNDLSVSSISSSISRNVLKRLRIWENSLILSIYM